MGFEVTQTAAEKIKAISDGEKKSGYGLRVRVFGGGCSGPQYQLGLEEKEIQGDQVLESNGLKLFLDPETLTALDGGTLDFIEGPQGSGFKISNPNAKEGGGCGSGGCGCGSGGCGSHGGGEHEEEGSGGCGSDKGGSGGGCCG